MNLRTVEIRLKINYSRTAKSSFAFIMRESFQEPLNIAKLPQCDRTAKLMKAKNQRKLKFDVFVFEMWLTPFNIYRLKNN